MQIIAINGSPHGQSGATDILVRAFLEGSAQAGAQTGEFYLAEHRIEYCRGCHACWSSSPGQCIIEDDLGLAISAMEGADLIVLASPLHFLQVSGQLKVFIDRLTSTGGNPHAPKPETGGGPLRLAAIMSAGFPKPEAFRAVSLWMEDLASLLGRELFMEAYAGGARRLPRPEQTAQPAATEPAALAYLDALGEAGRLAAQGESLGAAVREGLKAGF